MALQFARRFIQLESSSGIVLFFAALLAVLIDNTALAPQYDRLFHTIIQISFGQYYLAKPLLAWINDGMMAIFFLFVGLEIKREIVQGELNTVSKATLPAIAAVGGMVVPAFIYLCVNWSDPVALKGWAIPAATDTAFSLAILALLGKRIPVNLKIFLTALAIFDDIGAIIVMAIFYSTSISFMMLFFASLFIFILMLMNYFRVKKLIYYYIVGTLLWLCVLKSGVHATLAGLILALVIPVHHPENPTKSPLHRLEKKLHPIVAYAILPVFAFANAGVSFSGMSWRHVLEPIPLGIALALFLGKQIGIWGATMCAVKAKIGELPDNMTSLGLYGMSLTAGVGFTMSLFIGTLAFHSVPPFAAYVRLGVIFGSLLSGLAGYWVLRVAYNRA